MYDLKKRAYISTLGELRSLLADLPDDTEISGAGADGAWLHFDNEKNFVCIDPESLGESVEEYYTDDEEQKEEEQMKEHGIRLKGIKEDWQTFFAGNKLMRTFQVIDDTVDEEGGDRFGECWDYELYNVNLTIADSGQLGKQGNTTREDAIKEVLSWNHLEHEKRNYICVTEDLMELCEKCD